MPRTALADDGAVDGALAGPYAGESMMSGWQRRTALALLVLALGGLAAPAAAALASHSCHPATMATTATHDVEGEAPTHCQWLTPTSCCDQIAAVGQPPAFGPARPAASFQVALLWSPRWQPMQAPATAPTSQATALSTIVLLL